jgi:hypothetical protein
VSTILKALKKLEQERDALKSSGPLPAFSGPGAGRRWRPAFWPKKWAFGFGALLAGLVLLYFFAPFRNGSPQQMRHPPAAHKPPPQSTASPNRNIVRPTPPAKRPLIARGAVSPEPVAPGAENRQAPPDATDFRRPPALPTPQPTAAPAETVQSGPPTEQRPEPVQPAVSTAISGRNPVLPAAIPGHALTRGPAKAANNPQPSRSATGETLARKAPAPSQKRSADTYDNSPALTDGRLKVHAIAWSATAEDRMAVINSRVVHEGDSVDGFGVVAIRSEDVVVRDKEKGLFRVVFGRP